MVMICLITAAIDVLMVLLMAVSIILKEQAKHAEQARSGYSACLTAGKITNVMVSIQFPHQKG